MAKKGQKKRNCSSGKPKAKPGVGDCAKRGFGQQIRSPTTEHAVPGHDDGAWSQDLPEPHTETRLITKAKGDRVMLTDPATGHTLECVALATAEVTEPSAGGGLKPLVHFC